MIGSMDAPFSQHGHSMVKESTDGWSGCIENQCRLRHCFAVVAFTLHNCRIETLQNTFAKCLEREVDIEVDHSWHERGVNVVLCVVLAVCCGLGCISWNGV